MLIVLRIDKDALPRLRDMPFNMPSPPLLAHPLPPPVSLPS